MKDIEAAWNTRAAIEAIGIEQAVEALTEARAKFGFIENAPAWGAPDKWEPTPFEVRQLARSEGAKIDATLATLKGTVGERHG